MFGIFVVNLTIEYVVLFGTIKEHISNVVFNYISCLKNQYRTTITEVNLELALSPAKPSRSA